MSVNDRNDWDDGLDFESLADEQLEAATEPEPRDEELPAEDPVDEYAEEYADDYSDSDEDAGHEEPTEAEPERPRARRTSRPRVSGAGLGLLFAFSIIVAAVGIGGALVLALGVDPVSLWQPESFRQVDQILDLDQNPLNLVYIVTLATLLLTLLGGWGIARAVRKVGERASRDAELLERVSDLRIDQESGWQDDVFRDHPRLASFVAENLGTWRMQELRQKRATGLEGELQRLTKAAAADEREQIADRYDHPAVGSMADEISRYYDERDSARREAEATRTKEREESQAVVKAVTEVAGWNLSFTDRVGVQGAAAAGLASRLRDLVTGQDGNTDGGNEQALEAVGALRKEIQSLGAGDSETGTADLIDLADRGNKLAFQIAMEVARLGTRGERLLPMTQALEELTTDVREAAEKLVGPTESGELDAFRDRCRSRLISLEEQIESNTGSGSLNEELEEALPAAKQLAGQLGTVAESGNDQTRRINELGAACADLLGLEYDPDQVAPLDLSAKSTEDDGFTRFDPFSGREVPEEEDTPLAADPFGSSTTEPATDEADVSVAADQEYDPWGGERSLDGEISLDSDTAPAEVPVVDEKPVVDDDPVVAEKPAVEEQPAVEVEPLEVENEAVDLSSYGAQKIADEVADEVIDLAAYDAVRIDDDPTPAAPAASEESVHELAEFGAVRIN